MARKWLVILLAVGATIVAFALLLAALQPATDSGLHFPPEYADDAFVEQMFAGKLNLETVQHFDRVEAHRLDGEVVRENPKQLSSYQTVGEPITLPPDLADSLARSLSEGSSYYRGANLCVPYFGVQLSFFRDDERIDVLLCFECSTLLVFHNGVNIGYAFFRSQTHNQLASALKAAFPDDPEIQAIPPLPAADFDSPSNVVRGQGTSE